MSPAGAEHEPAVQPPTFRTLLPLLTSPQTLFHALTYLCSFGTELAVNSVLAAYYLSRFSDSLTPTSAANHAAVFGFLNFVTRPLGGAVADLVYKYSGGGEIKEGRGLWWKKGWVVVCGVISGVVLIVLGVRDGQSKMEEVFGLVAVAAVFVEAGNGANFSLVPHVHPQANGVVSGVTGAGGNLGGVVFAVVMRFMDGGTGYGKGFWVIGVVNVLVCLAVSWVPPLPRGQRGG